jgi:hypothetical protein
MTTTPTQDLTVAQGQNFSSEELSRRMLERRAIGAVIWGMPKGIE